LVAVDSSEKDHAIQELQVEREARHKAEERHAKVMLDCEMAKMEVDRLKRSLAELKRLSVPDTGLSGVSKCHDFPLMSQSDCTLMYQLYSSCAVSEGDSIRLLDFTPEQRILACSRQHSSGCGILKVSISDPSHKEYVGVHSKIIKDLHFSPAGDSLLLSCSLDKTIKLTSLQTNTIVQNYLTPCPAWSCCWNRNDCNLIFCGLCNGKVLVFDLRRTSGPVTELGPVGKSCPVISINSLLDKGILIATFGDLALWKEENSVWQLQSLLKPEAPVTSLDFDSGSLHTILSLRLPKENNRCQHLVGQLQANDDISSSGMTSTVYSYTPGLQLDGGMHCTLMTRSRICSIPDSTLVAVAADEATRTVCVWDMQSGALKQRLPPSSSPVLDIQPFTVDGCHYLATSTEHQLIVYSWK
jgi:E3 ubiquitin-protein ligase RFWD3